MTEYGFIASFLTFLPVSGYAISQPYKSSVEGWICVFFMGIVCSSIAYILWPKAMMLTTGTMIVTNALFLEPALTTVLGMLVLKEYPSYCVWLGIMINGIGLWVFYCG